MHYLKTRIPFLLSCIFAAGILYFLPFSDSKVALQRLGSHLQPETRSFRFLIRDHCDALTFETKTEEAIAKAVFPTLAVPAKRSCQLIVQESSLSRFHLVTNWSYGISVLTPDKKLLLEKTYQVHFPRPLILLPIVIFFLSIFYEFSFWSLGLTVSSYLLLLFGLNLKHGIEETARTLTLMVETDKTWLGLCLLVLFLKIAKSREHSHAKVSTLTPAEIALNRILLGATGLWSPGFFTIFAVLLMPVRASLRRLRTFFDGHVVICAISLYLLASQDKPSLELLRSSLLLPRYFSFTFFLLVFVVYGSPRRKKQSAIWRLPDIRRYFFSILAEELISFYVPLMRTIPTLSRVALMLLIAELTLHKHIHWKEVFRKSLYPVCAIILCALLSILSTESGITDLGLALCQPQAHPTALVLFTYISGLFLGILTGSFSTAFFALIPHFANIQTLPIARAALLDGILAGNLLSPFSLFNIIPAILFGIGFQDLIRFRCKQLWIPLLIGGAIYAVSAVNSVAILRPVTFIFLCLVAAAVKLKKSNWRISRIWPWETRAFAAQPKT